MHASRLHFLFLNVGHFLDHLFILIFATVAALWLTSEWGMIYAELIPYATPGFIAFGVFSIPAGWLADKWSRAGMMTVFFVGIGLSSFITGFAESPLEIAIGLSLIGVFAAIYHPVGLAMVVEGRDRAGMALAVNGVFGNMGVASAALLTGVLIDMTGWRAGFFVPGIISILIGLLYWWCFRGGPRELRAARARPAQPGPSPAKSDLVRVFGVILFTTALGGLIFQSTTFALPKIFDERLGALAGTASLIGWYAFLAFTVAALAQLVVGYLVDRHSVRLVFACVAVFQGVFFFAMINLDGVMSLIVAVAFMLGVFGQIPINDVLIGRFTQSAWRSRAFAVRYIVTFTVSASAVPTIAWVHGAWGFGTLFQILAVGAVLIFLAVLALPRIRPV